MQSREAILVQSNLLQKVIWYQFKLSEPVDDSSTKLLDNLRAANEEFPDDVFELLNQYVDIASSLDGNQANNEQSLNDLTRALSQLQTMHSDYLLLTSQREATEGGIADEQQLLDSLVGQGEALLENLVEEHNQATDSKTLEAKFTGTLKERVKQIIHQGISSSDSSFGLSNWNFHQPIKASYLYLDHLTAEHSCVKGMKALAVQYGQSMKVIEALKNKVHDFNKTLAAIQVKVMQYKRCIKKSKNIVEAEQMLMEPATDDSVATSFLDGAGQPAYQAVDTGANENAATNILKSAISSEQEALTIPRVRLEELLQKTYHEKRNAGFWRGFCCDGSTTIENLKKLLTSTPDAEISLVDIRQAIHRKVIGTAEKSGTDFVLHALAAHFQSEAQEMKNNQNTA
jgi:hypothetical protein